MVCVAEPGEVQNSYKLSSVFVKFQPTSERNQDSKPEVSHKWSLYI